MDECACNPNYTLGDTVTGGGYFLNPQAVLALNNKNKLNDKLRYLTVGEDTIFALLVASEGFILSDPPANNNFMAINWRGLPMPLEQLVLKNKKIIHPVRMEDAKQESIIRDYFKKVRIKCAAKQLTTTIASKTYTEYDYEY